MTVHSLMWGPPGWRLPVRSGPSTSMSSYAGFSLSAPVPVLELLPSHLCHPRAVTPNGCLCIGEHHPRRRVRGPSLCYPPSCPLSHLAALSRLGCGVCQARVWGDVEQGCAWLLLGSEEVRGGEHGLSIQPSGGDGLIHQGHRHTDL